MQRLTAEQFSELTRGAEVLSRDTFGDKVLRRPDGTIVKLFRRKRLLSSALFWPYAARFATAAGRLKQLGIESVEVTGAYSVPAIQRHAVTYPFVEGRTLRDALTDSSTSIALQERLLLNLAQFLAKLHERGVYFRAIHLGNVLLRPDGVFSLIDVSEASFYRRPLRPVLRARNFRPLTKYPEDRQALQQFGIERFLNEYLHHANSSQKDCLAFLQTLKSVDSAFDLSTDNSSKQTRRAA